MTFSEKAKKEITDIKLKKYCCHSSFLLGLLADCKIDESGTKGIYTTVSKDSLELAMRGLANTWKTTFSKTEEMKMGRPFYTLEFDISERAKELLSLVNDGEMTGRCPACEESFTRGIFVSYGTISDISSGYHLEMKFKNAKVARLVFGKLSEMGIEPKIINRKSSIGLYYKSSTAIEDVLAHLGAIQCYFELLNLKEEKHAVNMVNRRINCETGNISKSVDAAQKQIAAISKIESAGKLAMLPDELFDTARLRLDNPSVSLAELARLHNPPISKSGITHRLAKIMEYADEIKIQGGEE